MKTTQFITNTKVWQSIFVAIMFLFSFSINSQNVGDDLMANTNGALDTSSGVTASGAGCLPGGAADDGVTACGWTSAQGVNYAPTTNGNGSTHSGDRMWKMFAGNGGNGEFVAQEFSQLQPGTYTLTFFHKWTNGGAVDYSAGDGPQLTLKISDGNGGWTNLFADEVPLGNIGAGAAWTEMTVTYEITELNDYRLQVYKDGGGQAAPTNMYGSLHLDTFSFVYTAAAASADCTVDAFLETGGSYPSEVSWSITDAAGNVLASGDGYDTTVSSLDMSFGDVYTLNMVDSYGDGWNGASVNVGGTSYTIDNGASATAAIECIDANALSFGVTGSVTDDAATFTFDIANFTVGAVDSGADGHIHYSLNGGEEVMVYSSDPLTLSELPVGTHTIVFTLVDSSHTAVAGADPVSVTFTVYECSYSVSMTDSYGDGWSANSIDISVGGVLIYDDLTLATGAGPEVVSFGVITGDEVVVTFNDGGNWSGEVGYELIDNNGSIVSSQVGAGGGATDAGPADTTHTAACAPSTSEVTFNVNMTQYGLMDGDTVHVNGEFTGWCGSCGNEMTDPDGDGIYSITMDLEDGSYFYKFTVNAWNDQEGFSEGIAGCTADNNGNFDRQIVVDGADQSVSYCWNSCSDTGCEALSLQGIIDFTVPSGGSDGKAIHVYAHADIADLSTFGIGVANNGGGTDGQEYTFDAISVSAGDHILVARTPAVMDEYMDASTIFNHVLLASSDISQNGDDAIELYLNGAVVELFGDVDVDGTGQAWEYMDSWAYKVEGAWTYGGVDCTDGSTTTCDSSCPYPFAFCDTSGAVVDFLMSGTWRVQAEASGHMGVGSGGAYYAEWWNANPWDKWETGLYDDGWTFTDTAMTHDTGDDGAIFGKKDAIDLNFDPDGTVAYPADNSDNEYLYYALEDYSDNYTVNTGGNYDTVTFETVGNLGFYTSTGAQEFQILETGEGYVYLRNVGLDGNSWYNKLTTDAYLSTDDAELLDVRIYPNPVENGYITILSPLQGLKEIQVYTVDGRRIMDTTINGDTLDVTSISSGFYMLKVTIDGQSKVSKLVVR